MTLRRSVTWILLLAAVAFLFYELHTRIHFDWATFGTQLRFADPLHILFGVALIYATYFLRSLRWAIFLSPVKRVSPLVLLGPQFIGFTAVGLFGRLADLTRPFLVARRVKLSVSSQIAVYTIERMFDLGAAAIIFSSALLFTPRDMPHHEIFLKAGPVALAITAAAVIFVVSIRLAGLHIASALSKVPSIGEGLAAKILTFRDGLDTIRSPLEFVIALAISLTMWIMIGFAYLQTAHAFTHTPELAHLSFSSTMLLMAASIGGSLLQLPILGWFTQIAVTATAMHTFYGAPLEAATACGGLLLFVTFLCIIPTGLIYAHVEGVSLREVTRESEEIPAA
jgi:uncharacterized membrane protein YbhN (UPF0104 family)